MVATAPRCQIDPMDYEGLVKWVALRFRGLGLELDDLIQEGYLGLLEACRRYQPGRGVRFSTYATIWVRCRIYEAIENEARPVRIPRYLLQARRGIKVHKINPRYMAAAEEWLTADRDGRIRGIVDRRGRPEDGESDEDAARAVPDLLSGLSGRDREILTLRMGLDGSRPRTLAEVARHCELTKERVRQIEKKAIAALRVRVRDAGA